MANKRKKKKKQNNASQKSNNIKPAAKKVEMKKETASEKTEKSDKPVSTTVEKEIEDAVLHPIEVPDSMIDPIGGQRNTSERMRRKEFWSRFIKIFTVSFSLQLLGSVFGLVVNNSQGSSDSDLVPFFILVIFVVLSVIVDVVMAIKSSKTNIKQKLALIFCMPTNYTWLLIVVFIICSLDLIAVAIEAGLPANFG